MTALVPGLALVAFVACALTGGVLLKRALRTAPLMEGPSEDSPRRLYTKGAVGRAVRQWSLRVGPRLARFVPRWERARIEGLLDAAAHPSGMTFVRFVGLKAIFLAATGVLSLTHAVDGRPYLAVAPLLFGWFVMDGWLSYAARTRQESLDRALPRFLDVLAVTVAAGVPPLPALQSVASATDGVLGEEMSRALADVAIGDTLQRSLESLRRRNPAPGLGRAVTALVDTMELGAPLTPALERLSIDVRQQHREEVLAKAARSAPHISLVIAFTFLPASLALTAAALLLGPATALWEAFK